MTGHAKRHNNPDAIDTIKTHYNLHAYKGSEA